MRAEGITADFELDENARWRLLNGLDDISLTLQNEADIAAYEAKRRQAGRSSSRSTRRSSLTPRLMHGASSPRTALPPIPCRVRASGMAGAQSLGLSRPLRGRQLAPDGTIGAWNATANSSSMTAVADRLKEAHARVRALQVPEGVRMALTRKLLVITAAAKHDLAGRGKASGAVDEGPRRGPIPRR